MADLFKQAIDANDLAQLKFAIKYHKARINEQDNNGITALHRSCLSGQLEAARLLVENGAELELRDDQGWSCLHYAASGGHVDIVNYLINSCSVDVAATSFEGKLAIDVAEGEGIVFLLASAILREGKEYLLLPYMDGSTSSLESLQSTGEDCQKWTPIKGAMSEEILRASQQFLAQSFGAYLDEKFNLNASTNKGEESVPDQEPAKPKLARKNSCPTNKDPKELAPCKRARLNCFNSAFSRNVLQRYAVSETNLSDKHADGNQEEVRAEINRAPNFSDLNNVNSETWIYSK